MTCLARNTQKKDATRLGWRLLVVVTCGCLLECFDRQARASSAGTNDAVVVTLETRANDASGGYAGANDAIIVALETRANDASGGYAGANDAIIVTLETRANDALGVKYAIRRCGSNARPSNKSV